MIFRFKQFNVNMDEEVFKVGTDATLLGAFIDLKTPNRILDIGTGSGVVALMLAQRYPDASITGIDVSRKAVDLARSNFHLSPFAERLEVHLAKANTYAAKVKYDVIVANPPYHSESSKSPKHHLALAKHQDALTATELLNCIQNNLTEDGNVYIIAPPVYIDKLKNHLARESRYLCSKIYFQHHTGSRISRCLAQFSNEVGPIKERKVILYEKDRIFTKEAKGRLAPFLINL